MFFYFFINITNIWFENRYIYINKLDPINTTQYHTYEITLINIQTSGITNTNAVASGSTSSFAVGSDPTSNFSVGSNVYLQNGTNLGEITVISTSAITIGGGVNAAISAGATLYKEGTSSTNSDTSSILDRNCDNLADAYNSFNYNKTIAEGAIERIEAIAKQVGITLKLETCC